MQQVKQALWNGGIQRSNKPASKRNTPGLQKWEDLVRLASEAFMCHALAPAAGWYLAFCKLKSCVRPCIKLCGQMVNPIKLQIPTQSRLVMSCLHRRSHICMMVACQSPLALRHQLEYHSWHDFAPLMAICYDDPTAVPCTGCQLSCALQTLIYACSAWRMTSNCETTMSHR